MDRPGHLFTRVPGDAAPPGLQVLHLLLGLPQHTQEHLTVVEVRALEEALLHGVLAAQFEHLKGPQEAPIAEILLLPLLEEIPLHWQISASAGLGGRCSGQELLGLLLDAPQLAEHRLSEALRLVLGLAVSPLRKLLLGLWNGASDQMAPVLPQEVPSELVLAALLLRKEERGLFGGLRPRTAPLHLERGRIHDRGLLEQLAPLRSDA